MDRSFSVSCSLLLLVGRHALEPRDRHDHLQQQVQLGVLGHQRLHEERAALGIDAGGDPVGGVVEGVGDEAAGVGVVAGQRVPVGDEVEAVVAAPAARPSSSARRPGGRDADFPSGACPTRRDGVVRSNAFRSSGQSVRDSGLRAAAAGGLQVRLCMRHSAALQALHAIRHINAESGRAPRGHLRHRPRCRAPRAWRAGRRPGCRTRCSSSRRRRGPMPGTSSSSDRRSRIAARLAVEGHGEAVRLVADALHQQQRRVVARQGDRVRARSRVKQQLFLLRDARRPPGCQADRLERLVGRRQLPLAAVDEDQVRKRPAVLEHARGSGAARPRASPRSRRGTGRSSGWPWVLGRGCGTSGSRTSSSGRLRTPPSTPRSRCPGWSRCRSTRSGAAAPAAEHAAQRLERLEVRGGRRR